MLSQCFQHLSFKSSLKILNYFISTALNLKLIYFQRFYLKVFNVKLNDLNFFKQHPEVTRMVLIKLLISCNHL